MPDRDANIAEPKRVLSAHFGLDLINGKLGYGIVQVINYGYALAPKVLMIPEGAQPFQGVSIFVF
jgi:hypothetical protein